MRKHRKWWMGFGLGIALGASLLQLILMAQDLQNATDAPKIYTQAELDEAVEKAVQDALKRTGAADSGAVVREPEKSEAAGQVSAGGSDGVIAPDATPSAQPSTPASGAPEAQVEKVISFYIHPGMNLTSVARALERVEIIEDAEDFLDKARPIARNIQTGTSIFIGKPTYDEIIAELTRKKEH